MTDAWPEAPIVTLLYDEAGTEGRFAGRSVTTSPLQRLGRPAAELPRAAAGASDRRAAARPERLRLRPVEQQRVRPRRAPGAGGRSTSATATRPFATPGTSSRARSRRCRAPLRPALACCCAASARSTAGPRARVDLYVANGEITRERIRRFWGRDAPSGPPARRRRPLRDRRAGRARAVRRRAGPPQARRGGDRGGGGGRPPDQGRRRRARARAPARPLRRERRVPGPRGRRAAGALYAEAAALVVPERRGVRDRRGRGAGRRPAGGGGRRGRRARDRGRRAAPGCSSATAIRARSRVPCARTSRASIRRTSARTRSASLPVFQARMREIVEEFCAARGSADRRPFRRHAQPGFALPRAGRDRHLCVLGPDARRQPRQRGGHGSRAGPERARRDRGAHHRLSQLAGFLFAMGVAQSLSYYIARRPRGRAEPLHHVGG